MSYPLSSPVDISDSSPVELTLSNTSGSVVWKERTDLTENLIFGTTNVASTDILTIKPDSITDPFGKIVVPKAGLTNGTELVNLMADIAATTTYDFVYPPVAPTDGQIIVASGVASNTFADLNPKNTLTVRKNPAPTEFSSIVAAIASIPVSPAPNYPDFDNAWVIKIYAGVYTET
nr:hypothetical protein [Saprospiraceae bacterium]